MSAAAWTLLLAALSGCWALAIVALVSTIREQRRLLEVRESELASLMQVMHSERAVDSEAERELRSLGWPGIPLNAGAVVRAKRYGPVPLP